MKKSIRRTILIMLLFAQGVLTAACVTGLVVYVNKQRFRVLSAEIERRISTVVAGIQIDDANPSELVFTPPEMLARNDLYVIRDRRGVVIGSSEGARTLLDQKPSAADDLNFISRGEHYRGRVTRNIAVSDPDERKPETPTPRIDIWYAVPARSFDLPSRRIVWLAVIGGLFWMASSCLIAWFAVARGMLPLGELAKQASGITERSWALSLPQDVRELSETQPLALALEGLVARLSSAFERERTFVSDAAHELKTAVAIQKSSLEVALEGTRSASQYRGGLERALEDVDRLNALVHRMLSLASIEGSDPTKHCDSIALDETILAACDQLGPVAAAREISIKLQLAQRCYVASEEGLLQTLWVTLVENAIRYSPANSAVKIDCSSKEHLATVVVEDYGAGIGHEDLPHIFERFYRGDASRSRDTGGFGLGLSIAKAIVERHNGQIVVNSTPGAGTTVRVSLPCA